MSRKRSRTLHAWFRRTRVVALLATLTVWACAPDAEPEDTDPEVTARPSAASYIDDRVCATCHQQQYEAWTGSHHDLAMQVASEESVLGDFNDSSFVNFGVTTRFFTEDGRFLVNTEGADGSMADFEVAYTFGVDPLQQYLIEFPGGRLQTLGVAWDTEQDRWFHLYPDERITSDDPLHWTRDLQNWNFMCAECHSTNLQKNFDLATDSYDTEWDAINVGCQSCHGPGEGHISWANNPGLTSEAADARGLVVNFADAVPRFQVESCAACHSRRRQVSTDDRVGEPFMDHFMPETLRREDLYHADGQILGEVYVYGSFLQSRMYQEGVQCTDCHNPHSLDLRVRGNAVCEQCHHPEAPMNRFPTLQTKNYNTPDHHFHAADSEGAQCVNCHMVDRTYMVVDPRRDHSFRIPRPDLSVAVGTPNACNDCHTDQTAAWAAEAVIEWYGPQRQRDPHYGEILAAGRRGDPDAGAQLGALAADQEEPAIVRATALELLAAYGTAGRQAFGQGLRDREPLVRASAITGFEQLEVDERSEMLPPLLLDPVRGVRLEAARVLAPATGSLQGSDATVLAAMLAEYEQVQVSLADTAAAHQNLGVIHSATGNTTRAVADYAMALRLDSGFLPASINLSNLLNQMGRNPDATEVLANAIERNPEEGELHYSLGLVQAEMNQLADAAQSLGRAADLLPARGRVRYNYGLALQRLGRREEAETQLLESQLTAPGDPSVVEALAIFYSQDERWGEALEWAQAWVEMQPASPEARRFLEAIPQQ